MDDNDFYTMMSGGHEVLNHMYDQFQEEDDWTSAVLGDEEDVIRQLVG